MSRLLIWSLNYDLLFLKLKIIIIITLISILLSHGHNPFTELFFHSEGLSFMAWSKQPTSCIIKYGIWELIFCRGNYSLFSPLKTYVSYWNDDRWSDKESPLNQQSASNRFSFQSRECQWMSWIYVDHLWFLCIGKKYFYIDTYSTAW